MGAPIEYERSIFRQGANTMTRRMRQSSGFGAADFQLNVTLAPNLVVPRQSWIHPILSARLEPRRSLAKLLSELLLENGDRTQRRKPNRYKDTGPSASRKWEITIFHNKDSSPSLVQKPGRHHATIQVILPPYLGIFPGNKNEVTQQAGTSKEAITARAPNLKNASGVENFYRYKGGCIHTWGFSGGKK